MKRSASPAVLVPGQMTQHGSRNDQGMHVALHNSQKTGREFIRPAD